MRISYIMELFYSELVKREVINVTDGRSLGFIIDIKLKFPEGKLLGIVVPGRKVCGLLRFFDKTRIYVEERKIIKIGGDVILVNLKDCDKPNLHPPKRNPCCPPQNVNINSNNQVDFSIISGNDIDDGDIDY